MECRWWWPPQPLLSPSDPVPPPQAHLRSSCLAFETQESPCCCWDQDGLLGHHLCLLPAWSLLAPHPQPQQRWCPLLTGHSRPGLSSLQAWGCLMWRLTRGTLCSPLSWALSCVLPSPCACLGGWAVGLCGDRGWTSTGLVQPWERMLLAVQGRVLFLTQGPCPVSWSEGAESSVLPAVFWEPQVWWPWNSLLCPPWEHCPFILSWGLDLTPSFPGHPLSRCCQVNLEGGEAPAESPGPESLGHVWAHSAQKRGGGLSPTSWFWDDLGLSPSLVFSKLMQPSIWPIKSCSGPGKTNLSSTRIGSLQVWILN